MTTVRSLEIAHMEPLDAVGYDCQDGIAFVTMACPDTRNALSVVLIAGLMAACDRAAAEGAVAFVLTGQGRSFSAGGDLAGVSVALDGDIDHEVGLLVDQLHTLIARLKSLPMPTVAAVNGAAVGAGVALALACDVRVVGRSAAFITGYVGVGATPDGGASFHLSRALGAPQALASLVTNRRFSADDLVAVGLADEIVEDTEVCTAGRAFARNLAARSFPAIAGMRELAYSASSGSLQSHLDREREQFLAIAHTPQFKLAMAAFAPGTATRIKT